MKIKIAIGSDHAGFELKEKIKKYLVDKKAIEVIDCGTHSQESCDYPIFCYKVGKKILKGKAKFGILICKTGIGSAIAANKLKGIRAGLCYFPEAAVLTREHNHSNVLVLGAMFTSFIKAKKIVDAFLSAKPQVGRHKRRVKQIEYIEEGILEQKVRILDCND